MASRYCLLWIPRSGLYYDGGEFLDGDQNRIPWRGNLPVFATHAIAVTAKKKMKKKWPESQGAFVVLKVQIKCDAISPEEWSRGEGRDQDEVLEMQREEGEEEDDAERVPDYPETGL